MEFRHPSGKKCAVELVVPLQMLFIQSLESGIIPECLTVSHAKKIKMKIS